ncbi:hypothetical protein [Psychrosphaera aestuarii]|uniref:hypothetical protein n=1 Tax=Psychrosphaera aestuarii TaxID=1266052 RepID=UPI001B32AE50|nr:hypothetical protein [Psychrosphaera aestuarii]
MFNFSELSIKEQLILEELFRDIDYGMLKYLQNRGSTEAINRAFNLTRRSLSTLRIKNAEKILQWAKAYIGKFTPSLISPNRDPLHFDNIIFIKNHIKFAQVYPGKITNQKVNEVMAEARDWFSKNYFDYYYFSDNPYISQENAEVYDKKITHNTYFYESKFGLVERTQKPKNKSGLNNELRKNSPVLEQPNNKSNKDLVTSHYAEKALKPKSQPSLGDVKIGYGLQPSFKAPKISRNDIKVDQRTVKRQVSDSSILYTPGWSLKTSQDD